MIAMALFVGAAAIAYSVTADAHRALDEAWRRQQAVDVARSRMAELEAGLITPADLRGDGAPPIGSTDAPDRAEPGLGASADEWEISLEAERSAFTGLTLVELTVSEPVPAGSERGAPDAYVASISVTLRQLVRLRAADAEAFELDDITRDLPAADDLGGGPP
jgi:hypothetical protein